MTAIISKEELVRRLQIAQSLLERCGQTSSLDETGLSPMTAIGLPAVPDDARRMAIAEELSKSYGGNKGTMFISDGAQAYLRALGNRAMATCREEVMEALERILGRAFRKGEGLPSSDPNIVATTIAAVRKSRKS